MRIIRAVVEKDTKVKDKDRKFKKIVASCDYMLRSKINKMNFNDGEDKIEKLLSSKELTPLEKLKIITRLKGTY